MHLQQTWAEALDRIDRYHQEADRARIGSAWTKPDLGRSRMADGLRAASNRLARFADRLERKAAERWTEVDAGPCPAPDARA